MFLIHSDACFGQNRYLLPSEQECICGAAAAEMKRAGCRNDDVNHPRHYTSHQTGVECIDIAETFTFNLGNALKYIWRCGLKSTDVEKDLRKAVWYLEREIGRLRKLNGQDNQPKEHGAAPSTTIHGVGEASGDLAARYHSGG